MGKAIGAILPYALGAAISVVPIIAIILMLVTPKAKSNGASFAAGFVLGLAVICTVAVALAGGSNFSSGSGPTKTVSIIKLLLGLLLLFGAFRQWRARPKSGRSSEDAEVARIDRPVHATAVVREGRRATEILGGWRTWLADNNATVMSVLLLVFAVVLVGQGISGLSG
jgi:threonine/homoserine/homoserine lactone efflux protein